MSIHGISAHQFPWVVLRSAGTWKSHLGVYISRHPSSLTFTRTYQMDQFLHMCNVDAEPLHRYQTGGYHPICLGDILKDGRYRILHKLGWGGYSTVWAARDQREQRYVAVKISVSERGEGNCEFKVLRAIATIGSTHPGCRHLVQMLDHFKLDGPNGTHSCVVLELLGPSVPNLLDARFRGERFPGKLAKNIATHALLGLDYLHQHKIGHGGELTILKILADFSCMLNLHTRNLAFTIPSIHSLSEEEFFQKLRNPETGLIRRKDGKPLEPSMPKYLVRPTSYPADLSVLSYPIKIVNFGESFLDNDPPDKLHTPLPVRAPEIIFREKFDYRVDLWSMGCMLFELVVGQPPFDSFMTTPTILVRQMLEMVNDELPERWQQTWRSMDSASPGEKSGYTLPEWLGEIYFDEDRNHDLTQDDILKVGKLVQSMLKFEPSKRTSAEEILQDSWFKRD